MLSMNPPKKLNFLPDMHDMRYKAESMLAFIKSSIGHNPYKEDLYVFMSKDRRQLRMVHYENNAFYTR